ncbi:restriction endonuclease subunit S [Brachyspira hyodysenteriae]|uniref:restriction endonuclease subunit S n=1 Tax=Brachyspira hyodysenteriae TaxID=159 RepID=UPI0022CD2D4E|nr:restriction endonuclease subunit S [Brachyspira hyodysenteriae]MCZ9871029.1 restriction endonuclease subunit S [Brachyspira hyodysenteriae]MCZ9877879.1 restriction endonuclease subunit S [Brachyspira hyodysenteriae]MCZ9892011.1 restriction endonuclease subunit S [Brachyspira hyodysenteriae]MCZ9898628.1 restriction endonuclease subunit S [Brachyspira hyodysenteriae]MCZ9953011.1 restriction endonuclease subunit S [Brachyspira hyodysenteriae]
MINNWEETKLGKLCDVIAGQSPQSKFYNKEKYGLPFYQGKKEFTNKYIGETEIYTSKITKIALPNDILMSVRAPVGPINYAVKKCCIGRGLAAIRVKEGVLSDFIYYFLLSKQDYIKGHEGTTFNSISRNEIEDLNIIFPPIEEQKKIVEKLDNAFQKIEALENNTKENIKNIEDLFKSYLNKILNTNNYDYISTPFENCLEKVKNTTKIQSKKFLKYGKYPIISQEKEFINGYWNDESDIFKVDTAVIIFGDHTKNIKYIDFDFVRGADGVKILKPKNCIIPKYFFYYLNSLNIRNLGYARHYKLLKEYLIKYPNNIEEQKKIVDKLDIFNNKIESIKQNYQNKLTLLEKLKKSILNKAFNG